MANEDSVSVSLSESVERSCGREVGFEVGSGRGTFDGDAGVSVPSFFCFCLFLGQSNPLAWDNIPCSSPSRLRGCLFQSCELFAFSHDLSFRGNSAE